jgi:hypothetical protein
MPVVLRRVQARRARVDGAQRAEQGCVGKLDRHRDVAPETVFRRRVMAAKSGIFRHMVDHDGFAALSDLMADGGLDLEFPAGR